MTHFNEAKLHNGFHSRISVKIINFGLDLEKICQNNGKASNSIIRDVFAAKLEILALEICPGGDNYLRFSRINAICKENGQNRHKYSF